MVRLASRSFLHLLPEVAGPTFDYPFYAQVLRVNDDNVTFRSLDGGDGVIPRSIALRHVVPARAVHAAGELSLLRRPVTVAVEGFIHYGQVTTFEENRMTVDSNGRQFVVSSCQASSVPPIVALLLQHAEFSTDEWSTDDLEEIQTTIMNRVLGRVNYTMPNSIEAVMEGVMDESSFPAASTICRWINPSSGRSAEFPLQHALDFAYFVDGGRAPVPNSVGRSFCEPPPRQRQGDDDRTIDEALELFDPFVDDDGSDMTEHVPRDDHTDTSNQNRSQQAKRLRDNALSPSDEFQHQPSQQRRRVTYQSALNKDASIVEMLRVDPDLLDRFLTIRQQRDSTSHHALETTRGRTSGLEAEPAPPRIPDQTSKYAFAPRQEQKYIHDQVTAAKHKGKSPNVFVCGLVRSSAVEFKALPGVCTRLYDIRFGSKGLSIRHFARISQDERVAWLESGGSNFDNLSATAEFTKAPPETCLDDVVDAARVFLVFAREYCCDQLIALTEDIIKFLDGTLKRVVWTPSGLPYVVFWVNDVLEEFRDAVEAQSDLHRVRERCSTDDRLLRDLMFVKLHRQVDELKQLKATASQYSTGDASALSYREKRQSQQSAKPRFGRIPKHVLRRLPAHIDPATGENIQLCMRYLSNDGCAEDSSGCPSDRGHFVPKKLPEIVNNEIIKRFGELKQEHQHL